MLGSISMVSNKEKKENQVGMKWERERGFGHTGYSHAWKNKKLNVRK